MADSIERTEASAIKDSGDRTKFETGAVRDMHEGKGRCDLLPMCVLLRLARHYEKGALKYQERNWEKGIPAHSFADSAMRHMFKYMDGQRDEDHLIAAIWNLCGLAWTEEKRPEMMDIPSRMEITTVIEEEATAQTGEKSWFTKVMDDAMQSVENLSTTFEGLEEPFHVCVTCKHHREINRTNPSGSVKVVYRCYGQPDAPEVIPTGTCEGWKRQERR